MLKRYTEAGYQNIMNLKRRTETGWEKCQFLKRWTGAEWETVWALLQTTAGFAEYSDGGRYTEPTYSYNEERTELTVVSPGTYTFRDMWYEPGSSSPHYGWETVDCFLTLTFDGLKAGQVISVEIGYSNELSYASSVFKYTTNLSSVSHRLSGDKRSIICTAVVTNIGTAAVLEGRPGTGSIIRNVTVDDIPVRFA